MNKIWRCDEGTKIGWEIIGDIPTKVTRSVCEDEANVKLTTESIICEQSSNEAGTAIFDRGDGARIRGSIQTTRALGYSHDKRRKKDENFLPRR